jgi:Tfp pilus assembly protein PilV
MPDFIAKRWSAGRSWIGRSPHARHRALDLSASSAHQRRRARPASQDGFLLIEVIVSALLVAIIAIATFTGLDVANRSTADSRLHDEAAVLAAQSQEQLRTDPSNVLAALQTAPYIYKQTVGASLLAGREVAGTTFTIKQEAAFVNDKEPTASCEAAGSKQSNQTGNYLRITSSVTWPQLGTRKPVRESSIITPPTGSALEVDVGNAPTPTAGVGGVTAIATYTAVGSGSSGSLEATTSEAGCLVFGGIPATSAVVEIPEKTGYVTIGGELQIAPKEEAIAPNITTHYHVTFNAGGRIEAHFTYNGTQAEYQGKHPTGDTFVVANPKMPLLPQFELGSTSLAYEKVGEERYVAATGSYNETAQTPAGLKYPAGDLFPFLAYPAEPEWSAYAGDCGENEPFALSKGEVKPGKGTVSPSQPTVIEVPLSYVKLELYQGYFTKPGSPSEQPFAVSITNPKCAGVTPNNAAAAVTTKHSQKTITGKAFSQLEFPFQPFGSFELCLYNAKENRSDKIGYENLTAGGSNPKIYLGEATVSERSVRKTKEVKEEEEAKTKRLSEEETTRKPFVEAENTAKAKRATEEATAKLAKEKREKEETEAKTAKETRAAEEVTAKTATEKRAKEETEQTTARTKREKEEKEKREKWLKEETEKKLTKAQREKKEKEQKTTREASEKAEKTAKENRATEEAAAKVAKEKREKEETEAPAAKVKREGEEAAAKTAKENREKEETAATAARIKREGEEAAARKPKEEAEKAKEVTRTTREKEEEESVAKSKVVVESGNRC